MENAGLRPASRPDRAAKPRKSLRVESARQRSAGLRPASRPDRAAKPRKSLRVESARQWSAGLRPASRPDTAAKPRTSLRVESARKWSAGLRPASRPDRAARPRKSLRVESARQWSAGLRPASRGSAKPALMTLRHANVRAASFHDGRGGLRTANRSRPRETRGVDFCPDAARPHRDPGPTGPRPGPDPDPPPGGRVRPDAGEPGGPSRHRPARGPVSGRGLEWGSGSGILSIAAARIAWVEDVLGLELDPRGVAAAGEKRPPERSGGQSPVRRVGLLSAGFTGGPEGARAVPGAADFILANPPSSSPVGDGFEVRRVVVRGAREYLKRGGVLLLSVSTQYGAERVRGLVSANPGFVHEGVAATTDLAKLRSSGPGPSPRSPPRRAGRRAASRGSVLPGTMVRRRARLVVWRRLIPLSHLGVGLEAGSLPEVARLTGVTRAH